MFSLASSPFAASSPPTFSHTSPLTPRSHNVQRAWHAPCKMFAMPPSPPETPDKSNGGNKPVGSPGLFRLEGQFSSENARPSLTRPPRRESLNPLMRGTEARRGQRREQYLGRVRNAREDDRLNMRGDSLLHREFLEQQREWENLLARNAPDYEIDEEDANMAMWENQTQQSNTDSMSTTRLVHSRDVRQSQQAPMDFSQHNQDEIDAVLAAEEREMQELVAMQEASTQDDLPVLSGETYDWDVNARDHFSSSPVYGSDDDEFDQLLLNWSPDSDAGQDSMDTSGG